MALMQLEETLQA